MDEIDFKSFFSFFLLLRFIVLDFRECIENYVRVKSIEKKKRKEQKRVYEIRLRQFQVATTHLLYLQLLFDGRRNETCVSIFVYLYLLSYTDVYYHYFIIIINNKYDDVFGYYANDRDGRTMTMGIWQTSSGALYV